MKRRSRLRNIGGRAAVALSMAAIVVLLSLASGLPGAAAAEGWQDPVLFTSATNLGRPFIVGDGAGGLAVVWSEYTSDWSLWTKRYDPASGWSASAAFEPQGTGGIVKQLIRLPDGRLMAFWDGGDQRAWTSIYTPGEGWSKPTWQRPGYFQDVSFAVGPDGTVHQVYATSSYSHYTVNYNRFVPGRGWRAPIPLAEADNELRAPQIASSADGVLEVVWAAGSGASRAIWSARFEPESGWRQAAPFSQNVLYGVSDPSLFAEPGGGFEAVWTLYGQPNTTLWSSHADATGRWTAPAEIPGSAGYDVGAPTVATLDSGELMVLWAASNATTLRLGATARAADGSWGAPAVLLERAAPDIAGGTAVVATPGGGALALYAAGDQWNGSLYARTFDPSSGWSAAATLVPGGGGNLAYFSLAPDGQGGAGAAWLAYHNGSAEGYVARFSPPTQGAASLEISEPVENATSYWGAVEVAGRAAPGAQVRVGNDRLAVGGDGSFSAVLSLAPGANVLRIVATEAPGRTTEASRLVTFENGSVPPESELDAQINAASVELAGASAQTEALAQGARSSDANRTAVESERVSVERDLASAVGARDAAQSQLSASFATALAAAAVAAFAALRSRSKGGKA